MFFCAAAYRVLKKATVRSGYAMESPQQGVLEVGAVIVATDSCTNDEGQQARPAPSPSPYFVPGLPHVILLELSQAFISYQDYHMLLLTLAAH